MRLVRNIMMRRLNGSSTCRVKCGQSLDPKTNLISALEQNWLFGTKNNFVLLLVLGVVLSIYRFNVQRMVGCKISHLLCDDGEYSIPKGSSDGGSPTKNVNGQMCAASRMVTLPLPPRKDLSRIQLESVLSVARRSLFTEAFFV